MVDDVTRIVMERKFYGFCLCILLVVCAINVMERGVFSSFFFREGLLSGVFLWPSMLGGWQ